MTRHGSHFPRSGECPAPSVPGARRDATGFDRHSLEPRCLAGCRGRGGWRVALHRGWTIAMVAALLSCGSSGGGKGGGGTDAGGGPGPVTDGGTPGNPDGGPGNPGDGGVPDAG